MFKRVMEILGLGKAAPVETVVADPVLQMSTQGRLDLLVKEYEFYKNRGGYRQDNEYTLSDARGLIIETYTPSVQSLIDGITAVHDALRSTNENSSNVNKRSLKILANAISPPKKRKMLDWMVTGSDFFVYPDSMLGDILSNQFISVLTIMMRLEAEEKEGKFTFYNRFVVPLLDDYMALLKTLREAYT